MEEWAAELDLYLLNIGNAPTCIRPQGSSIIDLSWCTRDLRREISNWQVREDIESLSDHVYITLQIGSGTHSVSQRNSKYPKWVKEGWDFDKFRATIYWEFAQISTGRENSAELIAGQIQSALHRACDAAAARVGVGPRHKRVYWWSEKIAEARRRSVACRRLWSKAKTRHLDRATTEERRRLYNTVRKNLRREIHKAKAQAWQELLNDIETDPWGLPYRLVLNKLRTAGPALTEVLDREILDRTLDSLFPMDTERGEEGSQNTPVEDEATVVTVEEVVAAIRKKGKGNTAPGLDGIRMRALKAIPEEELPVLTACYTECIKKGRFPRPWKRAALVLIPKEWPVDADNPKVRPICLLSEVGKTFETVIAGRIWDWLEDNSASRLSDDQFGFCPQRSTCDALSEAYNIIQGANDRGG